MKKKFSVSDMSVLFFSAFFLFSCGFFGGPGPFSVLAPAAAQDDMYDDEEDDEAEVRNRPNPKPIELTGESALKTSDGVLLTATYYPGKRAEKTVPLLLIHGWGGSRDDFTTLALYLQKEGHAVLVPDLRGHGKSVTRQLASEVTQDIDAKKLKANEQGDLFAEMLKYDLPIMKAFLKKENNEGKLNLDKLGLIGIESGAILATAFAAKDWDPLVKRPGKADPKTGDVKAVVLISPLRMFAKVKLNDLLAVNASNQLWMKNFSALVLCGASPSTSSGIETPATLEKTMLASIKKAGGTERTVSIGPDGKPSTKTGVKKVYGVTIPQTKQQGAKLIAMAAGSVELPTIADFVNIRLKKRIIPWKER